MGDRDDGILLDEAQGQEQEQDESLMDLLGLEDDSENIELMKGAAEQGKEEGILNLGIAYLHGKGVEQDFAEACYWFEQSRDAMAMAGCGILPASRIRAGRQVRGLPCFRLHQPGAEALRGRPGRS